MTVLEIPVELDKEWTELIQNALKLGITVEEIRDFLHNPSLSR